MPGPRAARRQWVRRAVSSWAAVALLASTLLASGAHQHVAPASPEVVCSIDHESGAGLGSAAGAHAAARPHRHHCASCQLAAKGAAREPAPAKFLTRPGGHAGVASKVFGLELTLRYATASPRGPPLS